MATMRRLLLVLGADLGLLVGVPVGLARGSTGARRTHARKLPFPPGF